jgi:hypothetical protein
VYKVLILDKFCKDILAPLLRINDLRKQGVTLHLSLEADRQPIPDVPAVYFLQPTPANVERVVQDAQAGLYDAMHVNFVSAAPGRYIEQLAAGVVKAGALGRVTRLFDQYMSFVALEPSLFSLNLPACYLDLNDPCAKDSQIEVRGGGGRGGAWRGGVGGRPLGRARWRWRAPEGPPRARGQAQAPRRRAVAAAGTATGTLAGAAAAAVGWGRRRAGAVARAASATPPFPHRPCSPLPPPRARRPPSRPSWTGSFPRWSRWARCPSSAAPPVARRSTWPRCWTRGCGTRSSRATTSSPSPRPRCPPRSRARCWPSSTATSTWRPCCR